MVACSPISSIRQCGRCAYGLQGFFHTRGCMKDKTPRPPWENECHILALSELLTLATGMMLRQLS